MAIYLKLDSAIPEFMSSFDVIEETPVGYISISEEERTSLQNAIDANPDGSVVDGLWVPNV